MRSRLSDMSVMVVGDYANKLKSASYLKAKRDRQRRRQSQYLSDVLAIGNWLYKSVRTIEHNWRAEVLEGKTPYDPKEENSIVDMLRQWMTPCPQCLKESKSLEQQGIKVRGSVIFRAYHAAAAEILAGRNGFFDDAETAWKWSILTAKFRTSPRVVRMDEAGRLYEMTGERFVPIGITPERVLRAFADVDERQTRTLDEIIASRATNGSQNPVG